MVDSESARWFGSEQFTAQILVSAASMKRANYYDLAE
jgi:hypothetical protein